MLYAHLHHPFLRFTSWDGNEIASIEDRRNDSLQMTWSLEFGSNLSDFIDEP